MVVNVSPAAENVPETKCSLEFASRARKVELGRAKALVEGGGTPGGGGTPVGGGSKYASPMRQQSPAPTPHMMSRTSSSNGIHKTPLRTSS